jgi:hypothetical protein
MMLPLLIAAASQCGDYVDIAKQLRAQFGEERMAMGVAADGLSALALFVSPKGETFTIVSVAPAGPACVVASGKSWERFLPPAADTPA